MEIIQITQSRSNLYPLVTSCVQMCNFLRFVLFKSSLFANWRLSVKHLSIHFCPTQVVFKFRVHTLYPCTQSVSTFPTTSLLVCIQPQKSCTQRLLLCLLQPTA